MLFRSVKEHDIKKFLDENEDKLRELEGQVDLVAGGPPCQGFSLAGKRNTSDSRNMLVKQYIRFVKLVKPKALIFENVHGFTVHFQSQKGRISQYSSYVIKKLRKLGYHTDSKVIDVSQYGVPQKRRRFILVAMLDSNPSEVFKHLENNKGCFCRDSYGNRNGRTGAVDCRKQRCDICFKIASVSFQNFSGR